MSRYDDSIKVEVIDRFGHFHEMLTPLAEQEIGWRAYFGLTREEMLPMSTIRERGINALYDPTRSRT